MILRKPDYYDEFKCIADKCLDSCCSAGWAIVIDDEAMKKYKSYGEDVMAQIDETNKIFCQCGRDCAFLDENKLCKLIIENGEDALCETCAKYPRYFEDYGNVVESMISMSCPEAARIILENEKKDSTVEEVKLEEKYDDEVNDVLLAGLTMSRKHIFSIIQDRSVSLDIRMKRILHFGNKLQKLVFNFERLGKKVYKKEVAVNFLFKIEKLIKSESEYWKKCDYSVLETQILGMGNFPKTIDIVAGLDPITTDWPDAIRAMIETLYLGTDEEYASKKVKYSEISSEYEYMFEHILYYFTYTYFLGSVYDYYSQGMLKLAMLSVVFIKEMNLARWIKLGEPESMTKEDFMNNLIKDVVLYCREVEHSDENLQRIENLLSVHPDLEDKKFLNLL